MTQASEKMDTEDRIYGLPRNVIDRILELLPLRDAARTSILSRNWRYVWAMTPYLRLDKLFCLSLAGNSPSVIIKTVDNILLQHLGDIVNFVLDFKKVDFSSYTDIDRWMLYVTRHGVKELTINMSKQSTYKVPSYIFNCLTLTRLKLVNCVVQPPPWFLGFQNLVTLDMEEITFVPTTELYVINAPCLVDLSLWYCNGVQYLNFVSSKLKSLTIQQSRYDFDLNCFTNCKDMTFLLLSVLEPNTKYNTDERSTLEKLCFSLPTLEELLLSSFILEFLSAGVISKGLPCTLNCLWYLQLCVDFGKISQTSYTLELAKSAPNLSKLEIKVIKRSDSAEAVVKYLDTTACLDQPLTKLEVIVMHSFEGSQAELLFIKLLFAHTPSLVRMSIMPKRAFSSSEERNITIQLMRFARASPMAELFYFPNAD